MCHLAPWCRISTGWTVHSHYSGGKFHQILAKFDNFSTGLVKIIVQYCGMDILLLMVHLQMVKSRGPNSERCKSTIPVRVVDVQL